MRSFCFTLGYFVSAGLACLFFVLQACTDRSDVVSEVLQSETHMVQEGDPGRATSSLGEMYSMFLASSPRWELMSAHRQWEPFEKVDGVPVRGYQGVGDLYIFDRGGRGYRISPGSPPSEHTFPFSWRFSDDGKSFTIQEQSGSVTRCVVDLRERSFVVNEPQTDGSFIQLFYRLADKRWTRRIDLNRRLLSRGVVEAQVRDLRLEIEDLRRSIRCNSAVGSSCVEVFENILEYKNECLRTKEKILSKGVKLPIKGKGDTRKTRVELLALPVTFQRTNPLKASAMDEAAVSSLRDFLSSIVWKGPAEAQYRECGVGPLLYTFDTQGGIWKTPRFGGDSGLYSAVCRDSSDRMIWRVHSVDLEEGSFTLTDAPLGKNPGEGDFHLVKAHANFIRKHFFDRDVMRIIFSRRDGCRFWITREGNSNLEGTYMQ